MKSLLVIYLLAGIIAWAGSTGSIEFAGAPVFALCALWIFFLQWCAFVPAYLRQTEKYYDLVGSLTYISAIALALYLSDQVNSRSLLISLFVGIWALRLGSFLFRRIREDGKDSRFDKIKPYPLRFFMTWSLQGLWVLITAGCALAAISAERLVPLGPLDLFGGLLWVSGFGIEVVADRQKRIFRAREGSGAFITEGLWGRSRHPNYFGEIVLWLGVALLAFPALSNWQFLTLVSPVFVFLLLTRVSGIPLLERKADKRWGEDPIYLEYKANTPILVPRLSKAVTG